MGEFDAQEIAARLKSESSIRIRRAYAQRSSKLDDYMHELLQLDAEGCKGTELQRWLAEKGINVGRSTVSRWLHKNRTP